MTKYEYYYNNVPEKGLCRNNLIYTSLISTDSKTFCQWYYNDEGYHGGHNQVVDPTLMEEKFNREVKFLTLMGNNFKHLVPEYDIDLKNHKIYLTIDGPDMWEMSGCRGREYSKSVVDWDTQMLEIIQAHKELGLTKYSLHPSSYFVVSGELKSMNYFFTYDTEDVKMTVRSVLSHISEDRRKELFPKMDAMGIDIDLPVEHKDLQLLAFDSFKNNFEEEVMEMAKRIYV